MIYITGDTHGDLERFRKGRLRWLRRQDTVIVLGDFGFLWDDGLKEKAARKWLEKRRYTILFLDGCHENFDLLARSQTPEEKFGATLGHIGGNLYYVPRGQIIELEGKKLLCFGGGESTDKEDRVDGENWWPDELPTGNEMEACRARLAACGNRVDYVLTHDAPEKLLDFAGVAPTDISTLNTFFDSLLPTVQYRRWYFGRYHRDVVITAKARCVFSDVIPLEDHAGIR